MKRPHPKMYGKSGPDRRAMATDHHRDYYGIRLITNSSGRGFLNDDKNYFPFTNETDRIPAYRAARENATWPRPDYLQEEDDCFIANWGERFPYNPNKEYNRRMMLDFAIVRHEKRQAVKPDTAIQEPGCDYSI